MDLADQMQRILTRLLAVATHVLSHPGANDERSAIGAPERSSRRRRARRSSPKRRKAKLLVEKVERRLPEEKVDVSGAGKLDVSQVLAEARVEPTRRRRTDDVCSE
jgi:hypothetical protein